MSGMIAELTPLDLGPYDSLVLSRGSFLPLTCLFLTPAVAIAEPRAEWVLVQPTESRGDLLLWSRPGAARVELDGRVRSYRLDPREELTEIVATADGWAAAGQRLGTGERRLFVVIEDGQGIRRLEAPSTGGAGLQLRPRLLVRDRRLGGVAWLEGETPRELTVRARDWSGAGWGPTRVVGPRAAGSQSGLASATLADGSDLLVWSAFDGADDEILYSRSRGGGWTAPAKVAAGNRVPDVAPAVAAVRGGALAAWSRFNGERYELVLARFRRGSWQAPRALAEGGLFPQFIRLDERLYLLYRTDKPRGWGVAEIASNGAVERTAGFLRTAPERPALELDGALGVNLRWPGRSVDRGYWNLP